MFCVNPTGKLISNPWVKFPYNILLPVISWAKAVFGTLSNVLNNWFSGKAALIWLGFTSYVSTVLSILSFIVSMV